MYAFNVSLLQYVFFEFKHKVAIISEPSNDMLRTKQGCTLKASSPNRLLIVAFLFFFDFFCHLRLQLEYVFVGLMLMTFVRVVVNDDLFMLL